MKEGLREKLRQAQGILRELGVITSYSIHYTKLYDGGTTDGRNSLRSSGNGSSSAGKGGASFRRSSGAP